VCEEAPTLVWVQAEYLLWWLKDQSLPPLVTTSATQATVGRIGFPDTRVLFGGYEDGEPRSGGRITVGARLGDVACLPVGVEASFFMLETRHNNFAASSNGDTVLARPFYDVNLGAQRVEQVANQRVTDPAGNLVARAVAGTVTVNNPSELYGGELNGVLMLTDCPQHRTQLLVGARYLHFQEELNVHEALVQLPDEEFGIPQTRFLVEDRFRAHNEFLGGQVGLRTLMGMGRWTIDLQGKAALGVTRQIVHISGDTLHSTEGEPLVFGSGGLLALPTNSGSWGRNRFSVVPEGTVNVGYQITPALRAFVGYNFLYWSNVVRPGSQVDVSINTNFIPPQGQPPILGVPRPLYPAAASDIWVQGMNFGVELRF
jgi:hypothetical protein